MGTSGLTDRDISTLTDIFKRYPNIHRVTLFGSRAKGNYKKGSDVDLAIMNEGIDFKIISRIKSDIEESSLPYVVDLVNYATLKHDELKDHIERIGIEFYKK